MRIGLDLDGVILDTEQLKYVHMQLYDIFQLHKKSAINKNECSISKRYNWSKEEKEKFIENYWHRGIELEDINTMPCAKHILELLKKDGHKLILITSRGKDGIDREIVETKLKKENITFDEYNWACTNKKEICKREKIDLMIDDRLSHCLPITEVKIKTLYFRDVNMPKAEENEYLTEVNNWGDIYRYISDSEEN